jgi:hypothetical protein
MAKTDFYAWTHENLAAFAMEATANMAQQQEQNKQLRLDLKDAINAYRDAMRTYSTLK